MTWQLSTYERGGVTGLAVLRADGTLAAPTELKRWPSAMELLADWDQAEPVLRGLDVADAPPVEFDRLLAPLHWPRKVLCAGVNYRRHMREMGGEIPAEGWRPFFFLKAPTTSVIGPHDPIVVRAPEQSRLDWEAELAVVIGTGGRDIPSADALAHVAGYCVANDVTARGLHRRRERCRLSAFVYDWFAAKSMDGSLPLGPGITPAFQVPDPQDLRLRLWVNGELQQDESTADMVCSVAELIAAASEVVTLEPGDVIADRHPVRGRRRPRPVPAPAATSSGSALTASAPWNVTPCVNPSGRNIMIFVTHELPVNVPGEPVLDRAAVWDGLVLKANNALPFVPSMTYCEVTGRHQRHGVRPRHRLPRPALHRADHAGGPAPGDVHPDRRPGAGHDRQRDRGPGRRPGPAVQLRPGGGRGRGRHGTPSRSTPTR